MKVFGNTKTIVDKTNNCENVPTLEAIEVVLVQFSLVNNQS